MARFTRFRRSSKRSGSFMLYWVFPVIAILMPVLFYLGKHGYLTFLVSAK